MTEEIINILHEGQYTCVIKNSSGIHTFTNRGVADLYDLYTDNPEFLAGHQWPTKLWEKQLHRS